MFGRVLLTAALFSTLALAQGGAGGGGDMGGGGGGGRGGMGGGGGMGDSGGGGGGMARRQSKFDQIADKLKLNKEQKEQVQTILDAGREEAAPLRETVAKTRLGIADVLLSGKSDDEVRKAQDAYAAEVAKVTGVEAKTFAKIYALLKPNQQAKASQAWDLMADIFTTGGRGGGRQRPEGRN